MTSKFDDFIPQHIGKDGQRRFTVEAYFDWCGLYGAPLKKPSVNSAGTSLNSLTNPANLDWYPTRQQARRHARRVYGDLKNLISESS